MPYNEITDALEKSTGFEKLDVEEAFDMRGLGHSGFIPLIFGGNSIYCYEPMVLGSSKLPDTVIAARVDEERDGAFNIYNPACMVYPKQNNCSPGDRISVDDRENLEAFRTGKKTTWKMSTLQHITNWISVLTFFGAIGVLMWRMVRK